MAYVSTSSSKSVSGYQVRTRRQGQKAWTSKTFRGRGALDGALRYQARRPFGSETKLVPVVKS